MPAVLTSSLLLRGWGPTERCVKINLPKHDQLKLDWLMVLSLWLAMLLTWAGGREAGAQQLGLKKLSTGRQC